MIDTRCREPRADTVELQLHGTLKLDAAIHIQRERERRVRSYISFSLDYSVYDYESILYSVNSMISYIIDPSMMSKLGEFWARAVRAL